MAESKRTKKNPRVLIVDDHEAIRVGLRTILAENRIDVVGDSATIEDALKRMAEKKIDVCVVDLNMGEYKGALTIDHLLTHYPEAKIVVYSMRESTPIIVASYEAGAKAFVAKSADPKILLEAIHKVASGDTFFMPAVAEQIALYFTVKDSVDPRKLLSSREIEIFTAMAMDKSNEEIANELGIGAPTVKNYGFTIRRKLNITNDEMKRVAVKYGLIDESFE